MSTERGAENPIDGSSYGEILRSSSIIGGAQAIQYIVGLVQVKIIAVLLGPTGLGLIGLYQSTMGLLGTVSGLGIRSSGVREVAKEHSKEDSRRAAQTVVVLRRTCWLTGLLGWAIAALLSAQISELVFGNRDHAVAIAVLGGALLLSSVSGGQLALLQGVRRIGDLARVSVVAMLLNTVMALGLYTWLGQAGIVPVLFLTAAISLAVSWWFARRVPVEPVSVSFQETAATARKLVSLGFAFMWGALLTTGIDLFTRSLITREYGVDGVGLYQAAWVLSGMFAGFVLGAMGADFYPRLTAAIADRVEAVRLVNEQIEIGILLVLPGLLATIALAPLAIRILYTAEFLPAAAMLPWFLVGVFGRVVSWPIGFIQHAKGTVQWFLATQTLFAVIHVALILLLFPRYGLMGVAYAFVALYAFHAPIIMWVGSKLIGFQWSAQVRMLLVRSAMAVALGVLASLALNDWLATLVGTAIALAAGVACMRGLTARLGTGHKLVRAILTVPGASRLLGMRSA